MRLTKFIVTALLGFAMTNAKTVMLIRHGEKINDDATDLSPIGKTRADCLINTFGSNGTFVTPKKIYAQSLVGKKSTRPRDTVIPLADNLQLQVDLTFEADDIKGLVNDINNSPEDVILVSWSNDNLKKIAKKFGIKDAPDWGSNVFNEIWIITDNNSQYFNNNTNNLEPIRIHEGEEGYQMIVIDENVEKCIQQKFPKYSQKDGAGSLKVNLLTIFCVIGSFLYFIY
ncbi:hypothetical protein BCR32DRAFT_328563 [Anaeromyces robustus]|uniref:Phosphoglycerate mutase-like protein n=1 Tax=Anaeromyces robustus TaxID=1754192 RepID=A0A1Y1UXX2_9FUNG|nr:hypothetical protein BCR32DRAFT_331023 [Anaeromyces robustus]ORX78387.1 hypothetical protein BCR32DRAFT_328563 [Anaeromyces robustus]|eukprot:ORX43165.1 hypothetical protein BCR32DRAFT_331023 [Anaeromyces robustus]